METYAAFLRGINVGGNKKVAMAALRAFVIGLGFSDVSTLLQSGNIVLRGKPKSGSTIESILETRALEVLGLRTDFMVRTIDELDAVIAANPFAQMAKDDPSHLLVVFLKAAPSALAVEALRSAIKGPEEIRADGRQLYVTYPAGIGTSRLTAAVIDSKLQTRGTARNWNTVLKVASVGNSAPA